jgi:uncharacterized protein (DUF2147 family)
MPAKTWIALLTSIVLGFGSTAAAHASPIDGLWLVAEKDAHVRIGEFHGALCGRIVWVRDSLDATGRLRHDGKNPDPSLRGRVMRDLMMVSDLVPTSPDSTHWKAKVYDPRNGHTYSANLTMESPDRLKLRGYVGFALLGRTAHWTRLGEPGPRTAEEDTKPGPAPALHAKP